MTPPEVTDEDVERSVRAMGYSANAAVSVLLRKDLKDALTADRAAVAARTAVERDRAMEDLRKKIRNQRNELRSLNTARAKDLDWFNARLTAAKTSEASLGVGVPAASLSAATEDIGAAGNLPPGGGSEEPGAFTPHPSAVEEVARAIQDAAERDVRRAHAPGIVVHSDRLRPAPWMWGPEATAALVAMRRRMRASQMVLMRAMFGTVDNAEDAAKCVDALIDAAFGGEVALVEPVPTDRFTAAMRAHDACTGSYEECMVAALAAVDALDAPELARLSRERNEAQRGERVAIMRAEKADARAEMAEIGMRNVQAALDRAGVSVAMAAWDRVRKLAELRDVLADDVARLTRERDEALRVMHDLAEEIRRVTAERAERQPIPDALVRLVSDLEQRVATLEKSHG